MRANQGNSMPSGLIALLDDISMIAKLAAASVDDIGLATAKAGTKAAGVVIDDTAVTPRYVTGLTPERELPIIWKIAKGSLKNKLLFLLPGAVALSAFAPMLITPILMIGGAYLAFEATEKIMEKILHDHQHKIELLQADTPQELEERQVAGAIRTDLILSAEIMAIALNELSEMHIAEQAAALALVGIVITIAVYGVVGLIVKLDDIGLHLAERRNRGSQALGRGLVHVVPKLLTGLSGIGTAAMLWVGGGILLHGLEELGAPAIPHLVHDAAHEVGKALGAIGPVAEWLTNAIGASIAGAIVGWVIAMIVRQFHKHPEQLIVD
jgi:predicted DNA repair protein MutK